MIQRHQQDERGYKHYKPKTVGSLYQLICLQNAVVACEQKYDTHPSETRCHVSEADGQGKA
jgi:hypothetical protein